MIFVKKIYNKTKVFFTFILYNPEVVYMKKIVLLMMACVFMAACMGTRGTVGGKKVCTNSYLLGVLSISELVSPCGK